MDLRERIVEGRRQGISAQDLSLRYSVHKRTVERYWNRYLEKGSPAPSQRGGYLKSRLDGHESTLAGWIEQKPDQTLEQLCKRLSAELSVELSPSQLCRRLAKMGYTFKKNDTRRRAKAR